MSNGNGARPSETGSSASHEAAGASSPSGFDPARGVPKEDWYWCGYPGHFIGGSECCFHLHTRVGNVIVSTVGDYQPCLGGNRERRSIGCDRDFETYVFLARETGRPEGEPLDYGEIDSFGSKDSEEAERQHHEMCERWATADRQTEAAIAMEARRAETLGSVHEGAGPKGIAQGDHHAD